MNKVLLIGGTGIISTHVSKYLIETGWDVYSINRGISKNRINSDIKPIIADVFLEKDLDIRVKLKGMEFDVVIDFLSYSVHHLKKKMHIFTKKCKHYVFISSATVYNNNEDNTERFTEDSQVGNVDWSYSTEKLMCENYLRSYANDFGMEFTIVRPYVTYDETRIPMQCASKKFFTMINRMMCGKPMPIIGDHVMTTLTSSSDFAVAVAGLLLNPLAYNEAYHITGKCEITWKKSLESIMNLLGTESEIVNLDPSVFNNKKLIRGLDANEYIYKSRDMVFDNNKICNCVPEYNGSTQFDNEIASILEYFRTTENHQVDYLWDARIDNIIAHTHDIPKNIKKFLKLSTYKNKLSMREKWVYISNRFDTILSIVLFLRRIRNKLRKK